MYKQVKDFYVVKDHETPYGLVSDSNGSDGYSGVLLFPNFKHVADMAGMYRSFRVLSYGFTLSTVNL